MANISSETLAKFCEPEWVSRAYGEYLLTCGEQTATLLGEVTDAVGNDALEEKIALEGNSFIDGRDYLTKLVQISLQNDGITDINALLPGTPSFNSRFEEMYDDVESELHAKYDELQDEFDNINISDVDLLYDVTPDEVALTCDSVNTILDNLTNAIFVNHHLPSGAKFALNEGFVDFKALFKGVIASGAIGETLKDFALSATNGQDVTIANIHTNFSEVINQIKANFASAVAWGQGFLTVGKGSVSDAIASFDANISNIIRDASSKFASTLNNVKATITNCANNAISFCSTAYEMLGWKQVVDDVFTTINSTNVASYTGASPFSCIALKTAGDALVATGKTIAVVAAGVFTGVYNILKKLWNKAWPFVSMVTNNPIDIQIADSHDQSYTVRGMQYQSIADMVTPQLRFHVQEQTGEAFDSILYDLVNDKLKDKWYGIDLYFGQLCFRIRGGEEYGSNEVDLFYDVIFKPKCLDFNGLNESWLFPIINMGEYSTYNCWGNPNATNTMNFEGWLARGQYYFNDEDYLGDRNVGEAKAWLGFGAALMLTEYLGHKVMLELNSSMSSEYSATIDTFTDLISERSHSFRADSYPVCVMSWDRIPGPWNPDVTPKTVPNNLTNKDFMVMCSGYDENISQVDVNLKGMYWFDPDAKNSHSSGANKRGLGDIVGALILAFIIQQYDKLKSPDDYVFLPYCKDTENFDGGRYKIMTDQQYAAIMELIANAVVIVAVVALSVLICKSFINFFKDKKMVKWASRQGVLDNKMWNGGKLTMKERWQYRRACKKNGAIAEATSGLVGGANLIESATNGISTLKDANLLPETTNDDTLVYPEVFDVLQAIKTRIG